MSETPPIQLDFSSIAPYRDDEVAGAIRALLEEMSFLKVLSFVYPDMGHADIETLCRGIETVKDFQSKVAYPAMKVMSEQTISSLSSHGLKSSEDDQAYLYISNHRDIILDSALLNMQLHEADMETTETAIGSNLLKNPTVCHLTKLNKNFTVTRDVNRRELYDTSLTLSSYIRQAITKRDTSIWISQREGRAKDGNDKTQQGLLKMLAMSFDGDLIDGFKQLRLRPLALSYEYDPCDAYKLNELITTQSGESYVKKEDEDLMNIVAGISQPKGRVHLEAGPALDLQLDVIDRDIPVNDQVTQLALIIDRYIHQQAQLWPNNYIAADMVSGSDNYQTEYSAEDVADFRIYRESILSKIAPEQRVEAEAILIQKYAYPTQNKLSVGSES